MTFPSTRSRRGTGRAAAVDRRADADARPAPRRSPRRAARPRREGAPADGRAQDRRAAAHRRHLARLLQRHPVGPERTAVRAGRPQGRRAVRGVPGLRGGPRARAVRHQPVHRHRRRAHLGGAREPVRAGGAGTEGSRRRRRPARHRGNRAPRVRRRRGPGRAGADAGQRHAGDGRLPGGEGRARAGADEASPRR